MFGQLIFFLSSGYLCFLFYINVISSSFVEQSLMTIFGLCLEHCLAVSWASKCPYGSCLYSGFNSLTVVFKTASRSTLSYWESYQFQVPGLTLNTFPWRAPVEMWEPSNGKSSSGACSRCWQNKTHYTLDLSLLPSSCRGPQGPHWFLEMPLARVSAVGENSSEFWLTEKLQNFLFMSPGGCFLFSVKNFHKPETWN